MGGPGAAASIPEIQTGLINSVGQGIQHQISRDVWSAVTARVPGQVLQQCAEKIPQKIQDKLPKKVADQVVKDLTTMLPDDLNLYLLEEISERIIPQLHRDLDAVIFERISSSLSFLLPRLVRRGLTPLLVESLTDTLTHTLTSTLSISLASRTGTSGQDYYCGLCSTFGQACNMCPTSSQSLYYTVYHATYYSDYYAAYYSQYYVDAADKVNTKLAEKDEKDSIMEAAWKQLSEDLKKLQKTPSG